MSINVNNFVPDSKIFDSVKFTTGTKLASDSGTDGRGSILDVLKSKMDEVNGKQITSENATEAFVKGDNNISVDQVMLSGEEAKQSLQLALEVRNKIMDAFQELTKTQI